MNEWVKATDRSRNKKHEVFELSFAWKESNGLKFVEQKLDYIHDNASKGEERLVETPEDYAHSSARYYIKGELGRIKITTYLELQDIDLTKSILPLVPKPGTAQQRRQSEKKNKPAQPYGRRTEMK